MLLYNTKLKQSSKNRRNSLMGSFERRKRRENVRYKTKFKSDQKIEVNFCAFQAGTENIAPQKDVLKLATVTDNAKPIMLWNGNVGVSPDGLDWVAICRWNRIVRIARTMTEVSIPTRVRHGTSAARHECGKARVRQGTSAARHKRRKTYLIPT